MKIADTSYKRMMDVRAVAFLIVMFGASLAPFANAETTSRGEDATGYTAKSIQIVDEENVSFAGESAVRPGAWPPGETIPSLPCIWVLRSLSETNQAIADTLHVEAGKAYIQLPEDGGDTTTFRILPDGKRLVYFADISPGASRKDLEAEYIAYLRGKSVTLPPIKQ